MTLVAQEFLRHSLAGPRGRTEPPVFRPARSRVDANRSPAGARPTAPRPNE
jgi:hypothetical protein